MVKRVLESVLRIADVPDAEGNIFSLEALTKMAAKDENLRIVEDRLMMRCVVEIDDGIDECSIDGLPGVVRACIDCGVLIHGGPTRCLYCIDRRKKRSKKCTDDKGPYAENKSLSKLVKSFRTALQCSPDCSMCSGEYCYTHGVDPCDCDVIDRHAGIPRTPSSCKMKKKSFMNGVEVDLKIRNGFLPEAEGPMGAHRYLAGAAAMGLVEEEVYLEIQDTETSWASASPDAVLAIGPDGPADLSAFRICLDPDGCLPVGFKIPDPPKEDSEA